MAANKTTENEKSVKGFIDAIKDSTKRKDCQELIAMMKKETKEKPKMWGSVIVGFGSHHYKYDSGREGEMANVSFSPRASSIALYLSGSLENRDELLKKLGKHKSDGGCIHIKSMADIDRGILSKMISNHIKYITKLYPAKKR